MRITIIQTEWMGFRIVSIPVDYVLHVRPEPGHRWGLKGREFSELWHGLAGGQLAGAVLMDPDIAADPDDLSAMTAAATAAPEVMHTAAVKLWPHSTGLDHWIWSHRGGRFDQPAATQQEDVPIAYVATGMLWCPARLLDLTAEAGPAWNVYQFDVGVSELALAHGIGARLVPGCRPKHLHFTPEHEVRPTLGGNTDVLAPGPRPGPPGPTIGGDRGPGLPALDRAGRRGDRRPQRLAGRPMTSMRGIAQVAVYNYGAQHDPNELAVVLAYIAAEAPTRLVEIGTGDGGLTWALAQLPGVESIITVDVAEQRPIPLVGMTPHRQIWRIHGASGDPATIDQVLTHLGGAPLDVLVIDGDHSFAAVERDWLAYQPLVRDHGLVVLHDTQGYPGRPDVEVPQLWAKIRDSAASVEVVSHPGGPFGTGLIWPDLDPYTMPAAPFTGESRPG